MKPPHSGFTIIELLVVVTIIVVLLALLVPSMDQAMMMAEVTVCGTTLNQMGVAQAQYGFEHRGMMTRFSRDMFGADWNALGVQDDKKGTWWHWPSAPTHLMMLSYGDVYNNRNSNGGFGTHASSTHLYFAELLSSPDSFYCVGDPIRKPYLRGQEDSKGFFKPSYSDGKVYSSYAWNPMMTFSMRKRFTRIWQNWEQGSPANTTSTSRGIMAMDVLYDQVMGSSHAPYYNLLHFDGSVGRSNVPEFVELNASNGWVRETWPVFFEYLDTLLQNEGN